MTDPTADVNDVRDAAPAAPQAKGRRGGVWAALLVAGTFLLKFKWLAFLLGKGKLLLFGLFKIKTLLSMALSMGFYAMSWGWPFALGLVLSIYVHEMGHVMALRRLGIPATAPMFIPGLGAFVRLKQPPRSPAEDARTGLAGPLWGGAAALACYGVGTLASAPLFLALAHMGALINAFNLIPVWQLDGGRAWNALNRRQRIWTAVLLWVVAALVGDGMIFLLAIAGTLRATLGKAPAERDEGAHWLYMALVVGLAMIAVYARGELPPR